MIVAIALVIGIALGWEGRKAWVRLMTKFHRYLSRTAKPSTAELRRQLAAKPRREPVTRAVRNGWQAPQRSTLLSAECATGECQSCHDSRCEHKTCDHPARRTILNRPLPAEPNF